MVISVISLSSIFRPRSEVRRRQKCARRSAPSWFMWMIRAASKMRRAKKTLRVRMRNTTRIALEPEIRCETLSLFDLCTEFG